jgi:hypothetical protein
LECALLFFLPSLPLLLTFSRDNTPALYPAFMAYLTQDKRKITKDSYLCIFSFLAQVLDKELTGYDEDDCWPILVDEFVEWLRETNV